MDILNVIEFIEPNDMKIESFYIFNPKFRQKKVELAEKRFVKKIKENGALPSEIAFHVENGMFELGTYKAFLIWSD